jgi:hypothetical protein
MDACETRQKLNKKKSKAIIKAPPEKQRKMEDGQRWRDDDIHGKREPVTYDDYEQGCRLSF